MFVFVHIPKTGGTTFQFILENTFGLAACHTNHNKKEIFERDDLSFAQKVFPRLRSLAGHNLMDPLRLPIPNPFYITFLRDPVARVISHYQDSVDNGVNRLTFEETLRQNKLFENAQVKWLAGSRDLDKAKRFLQKCHVVGLTEQFELSLQLLEQRSPCKLNLNYKRRRVATSNHIRKKLECDERMLQLAREYNQLDIELYSFAVREIFPKLCAQAGLDTATKLVSREKYQSEIRWKFLLCNLYNMLFYRQICKLRAKWTDSATKIETAILKASDTKSNLANSVATDISPH